MLTNLWDIKGLTGTYRESEKGEKGPPQAPIGTYLLEGLVLHFPWFANKYAPRHTTTIAAV